jgi:diadenylate cyclase
LDDILRRLSDLWAPTGAGWLGVIDIFLVALLVFQLLKLVRGRRAWTLVMGIAVFVLVLFLSERFQLRTLHWLLEKATILAPVALVILLLPELRAAIEGLARLGLWPERFLSAQATLDERVVLELGQALRAMARTKTGAIIVVERSESLDDVAKNGVPLQAQVTSTLLQAIFYEGNPLHDGAAIIRQDQVLAAACRLPLSDSASLDGRFHMRHRAGLGVTETADCIALMVSEERGQISLSIGGQLTTLDHPDELETRLLDLLKTEERIPATRVFRSRKLKAQDEPIRDPDPQEAR